MPGWFTPEEAICAIEAGYAKQLSIVNQQGIEAIAPSVRGQEGKAVYFGGGRCTFYRKGKCTIHETCFKPIECRTGFACDKNDPEMPTLRDIFKMWSEDQPVAQKARSMWKEAVSS